MPILEAQRRRARSSFPPRMGKSLEPIGHHAEIRLDVHGPELDDDQEDDGKDRQHDGDDQLAGDRDARFGSILPDFRLERQRRRKEDHVRHQRAYEGAMHEI